MHAMQLVKGTVEKVDSGGFIVSCSFILIDQTTRPTYTHALAKIRLAAQALGPQHHALLLCCSSRHARWHTRKPQHSMNEPLITITLTLTIDRTTSSCRASTKSTSLELLLHLHTIVGAAALRR